MLDLAAVGAHPRTSAGATEVRLGVYLPGIRFPDGYEVVARIIHERDQFTPGLPPRDFFLDWHGGDDDLWQAVLPLSSPAGAAGHFGQPGTYLYRYQVRRAGRELVRWFPDPFARSSGPATLSAFRVGSEPGFAWEDQAFRVPAIDDLVVYELMVDEFNDDFGGIEQRLEYLRGLGVNAIELLPVTNVHEPFRWGYMPLSHLAPEDRYGGPDGMKRLVNACHRSDMAVIVDAVYAHAHEDFPYNRVYRELGLPNPMMGPFGGELFGTGTDFRREFTRSYFLAVNDFWIDEYHVDGFRYDYVPGFYDGPTGLGYAKLAFETYRHSRGIERFQDPLGHSRIIQCAEHLSEPKQMLARTYSNSAWQNGLLDMAAWRARHGFVDDAFVHQLLLIDFAGEPWSSSYENPDEGDRFPVQPFQYIESHDHARLMVEIGAHGRVDDCGFVLADRSQWYRLQPFAIALLTCEGVPMLWQGQEFGENYGLPPGGYARVRAARPVHWEYFYDREGNALVDLYRRLGALRASHPALRSRESFYYHHDSRTRDGVIAYHRRAGSEIAMVVINFSSRDQSVELPFPAAGRWTEVLAPLPAGGVREHLDTAHVGERVSVRVPSNYGSIFLTP